MTGSLLSGPDPATEVEFLFPLLSFSSSSYLLPCDSCFSVGQTSPSLSSFWWPKDSLCSALQSPRGAVGPTPSYVSVIPPRLSRLY